VEIIALFPKLLPFNAKDKYNEVVKEHHACWRGVLVYTFNN
jgi:hypothetical protein